MLGVWACGLYMSLQQPQQQIAKRAPEAESGFPSSERPHCVCLLNICEETEISTSPGCCWDRTKSNNTRICRTRSKLPLRTLSIRYGPMSRKMKCRNCGLPAAWLKPLPNVGHFSLTFNPCSQFTQGLWVHSPPLRSPQAYMFTRWESIRVGKTKPPAPS